MSWRIDYNEKDYDNATLIAWEIVVPGRYLFILDSEEREVKEVGEKLKELFTIEELKAAGARVRKRLKLI